MEIKIANKNYQLYFGWDFLEKINQEFGIKVDVDGQEINTRTGGLAFLNVGLEAYDPIAVQKAIQAATNTAPSKPSIVNIRKFIEDKIIKDLDGYKELTNELASEIKKDPLLKALDKLTNK